MAHRIHPLGRLRAEHHYALEHLLKRIEAVQPLVDRRGPIYSLVVGHTSTLAGFLTGAANEIRDIIAADLVAEREHAALRAEKDKA